MKDPRSMIGRVASAAAKLRDPAPSPPAPAPDAPAGDDAHLTPGAVHAALTGVLVAAGIDAPITRIVNGAAVSRYEIQPTPDVKVEKVVALAANFAKDIGVPGVRVVPVITGRPRQMGIEIPRPKRERVVVPLTGILPIKSKRPLMIALGREVDGTRVVADLAEMPHFLIAGATNSGKSECLQCIAVSLISRNIPADVRLILIDPKHVVFAGYADIPHLLAPIIHDLDRAAQALTWLGDELTRRLKAFAAVSAETLDQFNAHVGHRERLSRIVLIADEFAHLMSGPRRSASEALFVTLTSLGRAVGIHLVLATQRPDADVVKGSIKANVPARLAFRVSSPEDSRIILGKGGAEQLLGYGDALYRGANDNALVRIRGAYVTAAERAECVRHVKTIGRPRYDPAITGDEPDPEPDPSDAAPVPRRAPDTVSPADDERLYRDAVRFAVKEEQISATRLQTRYQIGYSRASRILDRMEAQRIIGPGDGTKARAVFWTEVDLAAWDQTT